MPVLCDSIVLKVLHGQSAIRQRNNTAILAYCCRAGNSVATLLGQIDSFGVSYDVKCALTSQGKALAGTMTKLGANDLIHLLSLLCQLEPEDAVEQIGNCRDLNSLKTKVEAQV